MPIIRLLLPSTNTSHCRGCGASIDWYETLAGKNMPMNAGAVHVRTTGGGPNPEVGEFDNADSHWAACPVAPTFKKK
jgi:hypothetical protein